MVAGAAELKATAEEAKAAKASAARGAWEKEEGASEVRSGDNGSEDGFLQEPVENLDAAADSGDGEESSGVGRVIEAELCSHGRRCQERALAIRRWHARLKCRSGTRGSSKDPALACAAHVEVVPMNQKNLIGDASLTQTPQP